MCQIAVSIPDEVLYDTKMSMADAGQFARQAVALGYYTQSEVSIGYCAQIGNPALNVWGDSHSKRSIRGSEGKGRRSMPAGQKCRLIDQGARHT